MGEPEFTDVIVIGMGPGGEYAAGALAEAGLHVTAIEDRPVGGECNDGFIEVVDDALRKLEAS